MLSYNRTLILQSSAKTAMADRGLKYQSNISKLICWEKLRDILAWNLHLVKHEITKKSYSWPAKRKGKISSTSMGLCMISLTRKLHKCSYTITGENDDPKLWNIWQAARIDFQITGQENNFGKIGFYNMKSHLKVAPTKSELLPQNIFLTFHFNPRFKPRTCSSTCSSLQYIWLNLTFAF